MTTSTLVATTERGQLVLKKESFTLRELAEAVVDPLVPLDSAALVPFPPVPKPVQMTDETYAALIELPQVFGQVTMESRRALSDDEVKAVRHEQAVLRALLKLLETRDEAIKEYVRTTMDVRAEEANVAVPKDVKAKNGAVIVAATPRDAHGHYLLATPGHPAELGIPATNEVYAADFREGALTISATELDRLFADGEISREDYLSMTVEKRHFDEDKTKAAIIARTERMDILRQISSRKPPTAALSIRKVT